jgi:site-specific DNA-methyltransferase (adenine-specific)
MTGKNNFFNALGIGEPTRKNITEISKILEISVDKLIYYNGLNILPDNADLLKIEAKLSISRYVLMLIMEIYNQDFTAFLKNSFEELKPIIEKIKYKNNESKNISVVFDSEFGKLFNDDCIKVMQELKEESIDLIFADPPFNLNKIYLSGINDDLTGSEYLRWCEKWIDECIRILKTGGTFYLWNLPKWNSYLADYLNKRLCFKHWIATDIKYSLPISGRLYPSHYSLLMYTKGTKANTFHPDRLPMEVCNNCYKEIKDYGGYKDKMNPDGINLPDVWYDIPPVRHKKYKARKEANELSIKLLDRIIEMSSNPGDTVFDPFGGSGTTYIVAEIKKRKWIGTEVGPVDGIIERFSKIDDESNYISKIRASYNKLFPESIKKERKKRGLWTDDTFIQINSQASIFDPLILK